MARNSLFDALSGKFLRMGLAPCAILSVPTHAVETGSALDLPSMAIISRADGSATPDLHTPTTAGSRLNLTALETPASMSTISSEQILGRNDVTVQDAVTRSPGIISVATPGNGGTSLSARGFVGHASVMTLFDGSRLYTGAGTQTFPTDPWMVERIDVIRGPASVLYGEGATGAVINVTPKKPFEGAIRNRLRLGYGSDDRQQIGVDSGGSLSDTLSYRLTLNRQESNGWIDRTDSKSLALSAALHWQATDDLSFTLAHERGNSEPVTAFGTPLIDGRYDSSIRDKNYNIENDQQRYRDEWTRLNTVWVVNDAITASNQLYYIKSRRHWRNAEDYSWDSTREQLLRGGFLEIKHDQEQIGDRQTCTFAHSLFGLDSRTVVGAEFNKIRFGVANNSPYSDVGGEYIDLWNPAPGYFDSLSPFRPLTESETRTFALFAENRTQLSERWSLVTGIRRDNNHIDREDMRAGGRYDRSLQGGNWRAGLVFAVTEDFSLYGQYSTSEDGVNNLVTLNPSQIQMDLTESKQTEFGLKQRFWGGQGEGTLAAYHIVKKKLLTTDPVTRLAQQIGQQSSEGIEASLDLALAWSLSLSANASLIRAEYDEFSETVNGQVVSRAGNKPTNVPRRTANLWLNKAVSDYLDAGIGLRYVDERYTNTANTAKIPGYTVFDANVGWNLAPDVRLGLQVNNLFDRDYVRAAQNTQQWLIGEPRSFFVTADYSF